jgi:adenylate kinase family enzyme
MSSQTEMNFSIPTPPRIQILGTSCSGKSTFARKLSRALGVPHIELDALHWGPNWQEAEDKIFQARVAAALQTPSWIVDGSYGRKIGDTVSSKRNCVLWIDVGLPLILFRFFKRSIKRSWTKELLWGGCRETLRNSIFQKDSLLLWILKHHRASRNKYLSMLENPPHGTAVIRLKNTQEMEDFLYTAQRQKPVQA